MSDRNHDRASRLDTTSLSDALDRLGIAGQCLNIKPLDHAFRLTGRAFTILYGPAGRPAGTVGDYTWGGAFGTYFWVDPREDMAVVYMAATPNAVGTYSRMVRNLVLQAIAD